MITQNLIILNFNKKPIASVHSRFSGLGSLELEYSDANS